MAKRVVLIEKNSLLTKPLVSSKLSRQYFNNNVTLLGIYKINFAHKMPYIKFLNSNWCYAGKQWKNIYVMHCILQHDVQVVTGRKVSGHPWDWHESERQLSLVPSS